MGSQFRIVAHGGAGSNNDHSDGAKKAVEDGTALLQKGQTALDAVCKAVATLENDGRFNAGVGSMRRSDNSVQMDASCMDSTNRYGAVAVLEGYRNPILVARSILESPLTLLAGNGAAKFALKKNFRSWSGQGRFLGKGACSDTVGAVAVDGETFAAALSTGGTGGAPAGRVGDVPLLGCGLYAGPDGAVAATGQGESITINMTAYRVYQMLERGTDPNIALKTCLHWFEDKTDIGLILVSRKGMGGGSNRSMAWARNVDSE